MRSIIIVAIGLIATMVYVVEAMWIMASVYAVKIRVQRRHCTLFEGKRNQAFEEMTRCTMWWAILIILPVIGKLLGVLYEWLNALVW